MKKLIIILFLLFLPFSASAGGIKYKRVKKIKVVAAPVVIVKPNYNIYKEALQIWGVEMNEAPDPKLYLLTWEALDKVYKGQKLNFKLTFINTPSFLCGEVEAAGCANGNKIEIISTEKAMVQLREGANIDFRWLLLHEYAHYVLSTNDENEADKFANERFNWK